MGSGSHAATVRTQPHRHPALGCGHLAFFAAATGPTRQYAQTPFASIASGGLAFLFGRSLPKA